MKNATAKNDVQAIKKVLEEYLGNRKAAKVAVEISAAMQEETQHTHMGEVFYIHKKVEAILNSYLEKDEVQECFGLLRDRKLGETKKLLKLQSLKPSKLKARIARFMPL